MGVHLHRRSFVSQCDELGGLKHGVTRHDRQPQQAATTGSRGGSGSGGSGGEDHGAAAAATWSQ